MKQMIIILNRVANHSRVYYCHDILNNWVIFFIKNSSWIRQKFIDCQKDWAVKRLSQRSNGIFLMGKSQLLPNFHFRASSEKIMSYNYSLLFNKILICSVFNFLIQWHWEFEDVFGIIYLNYILKIINPLLL